MNTPGSELLDVISPDRLRLIGELGAFVIESSRGHPLRVAVDGRCGSGKTRLADELFELLRGWGKPVVRATTDDFHRPRVERHRQGRLSPLGYLDDSRDWNAIRRLMLDPLGPEGNRRYLTASFDLLEDRPFEMSPRTASTDTLLIVDGTFLLRPELFEGWDLRIYLDVSREIALERGAQRDAVRMGGVEQARHAHELRYQAAFDLYIEKYGPLRRADWVIDNTQLHLPLRRSAA